MDCKIFYLLNYAFKLLKIGGITIKNVLVQQMIYWILSEFIGPNE
jgi:hypothetical protein